MDKILKRIKKNKMIISYLFFGVCTTAVNIFSYYVCRLLGLNTAVSTVVAWLLAVLFAYVTNRIFVFESENKSLKSVARETISFFSCRAVTGIIDLIIMVVFVDFLCFDDIIMKIISNIIVIVLNYLASKLWIFKKG